MENGIQSYVHDCWEPGMIHDWCLGCSIGFLAGWRCFYRGLGWGLKYLKKQLLNPGSPGYNIYRPP